MSDAPDAPVGDAPAGDSREVARGLTRKIVLAMLFAALIFGALAFYSDVQELQRTAKTFAPSAFLLGLALAFGNYLLRVARWQYYLKHLGIHVPLGESALVFLASFVMTVTPGKVGEVFKSLLLWESRSTSIARTAPILVAERLTDLIALVMLTAVGSLAFEHGIAVAATGGALTGALLVVCAYRPLGNLLLGIADRMPLIGRISHKLHEAYDSLLEMTRPAPLLVGTAVAFVAWGLECGSLYAIVHGFAGVEMSWDGATFAYAASTIAGAVAMMPGGLGVTEVGMTTLLQALGGEAMRPAVATAATILVRIATLWFAVAVGLVALGAYRATHGRPAARAS